jgi:site-specific DNA-adenine methylase
LALQSERAISKGINIELINYYKVKKTVDELIKELKRYKNEKDYFLYN